MYFFFLGGVGNQKCKYLAAVRELVVYLEPYAHYEETEENCKEAANEVLAMLKDMPDCISKMKTNYLTRQYMEEGDDIAYIYYVVKLQTLLRNREYVTCLHQLQEFLQFQVMKDNLDDSVLYLPYNIKSALIHAIEGGLKGSAAHGNIEEKK
ncbi:hypothetical protein D1151_03595 [Emergencia sp. 1XD21-10]|nr:hypothetical protein [Emergencia sp. 1XD21-10]